MTNPEPKERLRRPRTIKLSHRLLFAMIGPALLQLACIGLLCLNSDPVLPRDWLISVSVVNLCICSILSLTLMKWIVARIELLSRSAANIEESLESEVETEPESDELLALSNRLQKTVQANKQRHLERSHAERMKKEFYAMITHDLRSPLTGMTLTLENVCSQPDLRPDLKRKIELVQMDLRRVLKLINELLEIDKIRSGKLKLNLDEVPLSAIVGQSMQALDGIAKRKNISIVTSYPADEPLLYADEERLIRVMVNLLDNALKHSPNNSSIRITVEQVNENDSFLSCAIDDEGPGIPAHLTTKIFEKFNQVEAISGTGLGLTIAQAIIQAHLGSIGCENRSDGGSRFWFRLPLALATHDVHT